MSAVATESCVCESIGAPKELRLCDEHHRYWLGDKRMDSVSSVIRTLLPTDYSKIDPTVLETARIRGVLVDWGFCGYLEHGEVTMDPKDIAVRFPENGAKYADDVIARLSRLIDWWEAQKFTACAIQHSVYSEQDGIAGTFDLATEDMILDLKCVSELQPSYALQLGAYADYYPHGRDTAIIHVTKDKVRLVRYDTAKVKRQWKTAVAWFITGRELKAC